MAEPPPLLTARLRLDALRAEDAAALFACRADPAVQRWQGWRPQRLEAVQAFIARQQATAFATPGEWSQYAIRRHGSPTLVGDLGLHFVDADTVELGITLAPGAQHQGLAGEALAAVLALLFGRLGQHRVIASVDPRNLASVRLLERLGLRREAHHRQSVRDGDAWADDLVYAQLAAEWRARQGAHGQPGG